MSEQQQVPEAEENKYLIEAEKSYANYDPEEESLKKQESDAADKYGLLTEFLKQLRPGTEMYRLSVPVFVLQPVTFLEKLSIYSTPTSLMQTINNQQTPTRRMLAVLAWVLSTWRSIPRTGLQGVKPYNPILGEQFHCHWDHADGSKTVFVSEQVKHHPPISAFHAHNAKLQFAYHGWVYPQTSLNWNSVTTTMDGEFYVELGMFKERYHILHPDVSCSSIFFGTKTIDIYGELKILCAQTGVKATIKFGENNSVEGGIENKEGKKEFHIEGIVNKIVAFKDVNSDQEKVLYNSSKIQRMPKHVKPLVEQAKNEGRRNWHRVTEALRREDFEEAQKQKFIIEERERSLRKERQQQGIEWKPILFHLEGEKNWRYNEYKPVDK